MLLITSQLEKSVFRVDSLMSARLFVCVCVSVYVSDRSFRIEVFVDTEFCFLVTY